MQELHDRGYDEGPETTSFLLTPVARMSTSAYRLSQRSSRRRRLLLLGQARDNSSNSRLLVDLPVPTQTSRPRQQPVPQFRSDDSQVAQCRLDSNRSLTWVFAGDTLIAGQSQDDGWSPLTELFADGLQAQRQHDRFVEALAPGLSIPNLASTWDTRIAVHRPDVLVVLCGHSDAISGLRGLRAFEDSLLKLLISCREAGILPIINTPPCHPVHRHDSLSDRQIYLEALRAEARSHNAVLVDHWGHWEWAASEMGYTERWYDDTGLFPGPLGHQQMQRTFLQSVGLPLSADASSN
ncbi:MAG: hypothetical protein KDA90_01180 [Planctomycetaceae bacterium]|nr:hypothetical protein [Planctomycetaceae bacterium]